MPQRVVLLQEAYPESSADKVDTPVSKRVVVKALPEEYEAKGQGIKKTASDISMGIDVPDLSGSPSASKHKAPPLQVFSPPGNYCSEMSCPVMERMCSTPSLDLITQSV